MQDVDNCSLNKFCVCFWLDTCVFVASPTSRRHGIRMLREVFLGEASDDACRLWGANDSSICKVLRVMFLRRATTDSVKELQCFPNCRESTSISPLRPTMMTVRGM